MDLKLAFNRINREALMQVLMIYDTSRRFQNEIKSMYVGNEESARINGVRRGSVRVFELC